MMEPTEPTGTSWRPETKIAAAAGIGMPSAVVLAWLLSLFGIDMPDAVAAAAGALLAAGIGYLTRNRAPRPGTGKRRAD